VASGKMENGQNSNCNSPSLLLYSFPVSVYFPVGHKFVFNI